MNQKVRTDSYPALNIINQTQYHIPKVTPSELIDGCLPWVHIAIGKLKAFLLGTFYGVTSEYLQEYLNEFCYRFNRRFVEKEIPNNTVEFGNNSCTNKINLS